VAYDQYGIDGRSTFDGDVAGAASDHGGIETVEVGGADVMADSPFRQRPTTSALKAGVNARLRRRASCIVCCIAEHPPRGYALSWMSGVPGEAQKDIGEMWNGTLTPGEFDVYARRGEQ